MDKLCIKDMIDFFVNKLPSLSDVSHTQNEHREAAAKGLARLCCNVSCARDVVQKLHDMGTSITLADFGDSYMHGTCRPSFSVFFVIYLSGTKGAVETNRSVLEAIRKCLMEVQKNFPATPNAPSPFTSDERLVLQLYEYLDNNFMSPSVDGPGDNDRLQVPSPIKYPQPQTSNAAFRPLPAAPCRF